MDCTLEDLANFIEEHDWIQNKYDNHQGGYCLLGAMYALCGKDYYKNVHKDMYAKMVGRGMMGSIVSWNDTPGRTKEEVLEFLRS